MTDKVVQFLKNDKINNMKDHKEKTCKGCFKTKPLDEYRYSNKKLQSLRAFFRS